MFFDWLPCYQDYDFELPIISSVMMAMHTLILLMVNIEKLDNHALNMLALFLPQFLYKFRAIVLLSRAT